jgi:hypothetical protein
VKTRSIESTARRLVRRLPPVLCALGAAAFAVAMAAPDVALAGEASWRLSPALAPPAPAGVEKAPYPVPVGKVGEISFWAPNRGLLITGGTEGEGGPVPAGVYAYDGVNWQQLSKVCGGGEGRIVWAGPDEFWTIANQRAGQHVGGSGGEVEAPSVSLCHFLNGAVAGSYAVPLEESDSWRHMTGGACYGPSDCWFGGADGKAPNVGAFHLHWNGSAVIVVYEPEDHAVTSMASFEGELYEGVQLEGGDVSLGEAERKRPAVIHTIAPSGAEPFEDLTIFSASAGHDLPLYGEKVAPEALQGLDLASDAPAGEAAKATQLWAAANPSGEAPAGSQPASLTVLRDDGGVWSQVLPGSHGEEPLGNGRLAGSQTQVNNHGESGVAGAIAPEPGSEDAWVSLQSGGSASARVALLSAAGGVVQEETLPLAGEDVGLRGSAGPIVCPAAHDCWMATEAGWLFHLSDGQAEALDGDPLFEGRDGVIEERPRDGGEPSLYTDEYTTDDSLANQKTIVEAQAPPATAAQPKQAVSVQKTRPLLEHVKSKFRHRRTLVISFTLTAKAHVQLIARRKRQVVAKTRRETLKPGRHTLSLTFDPARWPTKLAFEAHPLAVSVAPSGGGGGEGAGGPEAGGDNGSDTIGT